MNKYVCFEFLTKSGHKFSIVYTDLSDERMEEIANDLTQSLANDGIYYLSRFDDPNDKKNGACRVIRMSEIVSFNLIYRDTVPQ